MKNKICFNCDKEYEVDNYRFEQSKYCCNSCRYDYLKKHNISETVCDNCGKILIRQKSKIHDHNYCNQKCKNTDPGYLKRITESSKNANNPAWGTHWQHCNKGKINSPDTIFKKGKENLNWKGGTSKKRGADWEEQRQKALARDDFTCRRCDSKEDLCVHHIERYSESKNNELDNLITFCRSCHVIHERGYSKLIVAGEDLIITKVPPKTQSSFLEFAKVEFEGQTGMTLKFLLDFYTGVIQSGLEDLDAKVNFCMNEISELKQKESQPERKFKVMADGTKRPIKIEE